MKRWRMFRSLGSGLQGQRTWRDDMRKYRIKQFSKRITGQEMLVIAVGSSVLIWAGVLNFLLV
jgi:hypothetical protein